MEKQVFAVPSAAGTVVRDPRPGKPRFLPSTGDSVPLDAYWRRRLAEGVIVIKEMTVTSKRKTTPEVKG